MSADGTLAPASPVQSAEKAARVDSVSSISHQDQARPDSREAFTGSPLPADEKAGSATHYGREGVDPNPVYTAEEERRLVRKIDLILLPSLSLLYLLSFLDRSNIGAAKIDGMATDLHLGSQYPTALTLFFVGYVLFEIPGNWGLKLTKPAFWMPMTTVCFGIVSLTQGLVHNTSGLLAVRFFLGVCEASLFPGTVFIFSQWYLRKERVVRVSFFFSAAAAAGAFGGILAYVIGLMDGIGGKRGWQWIFIIEGLLTILIAAITFFTIPHYPSKTNWFTPRELSILHHRLRQDSDALEEEGFNWSGATQAFKDPLVYGFCFLFHGVSFSLYTISLFAPTIIQELGYASWQAQLLTTPPYVFSFVVTMIVAWTAKRTGRRAPYIIGSILVAIVGYIALITSPTVGGKYTALFLIVGGIYPADALLLAWPSENIAGATKRNTALAMVISIGNVGAIIGTQLYRVPLGGLKNTGYHVSEGLTILWLGIGLSACSFLWWRMSRANAFRKRVLEGQGEGSEGFKREEEKTREEISQEWRELGDRRLTWQYQT